MSGGFDNLDEIYNECKSNWTGVDWDTKDKFPINLNGMSSKEAVERYQFEKSRGANIEKWERVVDYVYKVEDAAKEASSLGKKALKAAKSGNYSEAVSLAQSAVLVESKWREGGLVVWQSFFEEVSKLAKNMQGQTMQKGK